MNSADFDRPAFEAFLGHPAGFPSVSSARRALRRWDDRSVLDRAALDLGIPRDDVVERFISEEKLSSSVFEEAARREYEREHERYRQPRSARVRLFRVESDGPGDAAETALEGLRVRLQIARDASAIGRMVTALDSRIAVIQETIRCDTADAHEFPSRVVTTACEMKVGSFSEPIFAGQAGFVIRKEAEVPAIDVSFDRARSRIQAQLENQARHSARTRALEQLRNRYGRRFADDLVAQFVQRPHPIPEADYDSGPPKQPGYIAPGRDKEPHDA